MRSITLLTAPGCHLCEQAKAVLQRLTPEYGLEVDTVELASEQGRHLAADAGIVFPPGVLIEGRPFSYGRLSERKLRRELGRATDRA